MSKTAVMSLELCLKPSSTYRVDGPSWRVTGAVLTGERFPLAELTGRQLG